jgi:hypothetical protein
MMTFPGSPKLLKGGIVLVDSATSVVQRIIALQYNPDTISRTLQVQGAGGEGGDRSEALRLKGPPVETIKLEAEIDATDQLEFPDKKENKIATEMGIFPQLAVLETMVYPASAQLQSNNSLARSGTLEIIPMEGPLALFVWSRQRVMAVRITELSITEEAFDPALNPIRARVSLGLRVLSVDDLGFSHKGGGLFMSYLQNKEQMANRLPGGLFGALGITGI